MDAAVTDIISEPLFTIAKNIPFLGTLLCLMLADVLVGTIAAIMTMTVSSSVSFRGVGKKVIMLVAVGVGAVVGIRAQMPLAEMVAGYYCVTEMWSIVENMAKAGVSFPAQVVQVLQKLQTEQKPAVEVKASIVIQKEEPPNESNDKASG